MASTSEENKEATHTRDFQQPQQNDKSSLGLGEKSWRSLIEVSMARSRKIRGSNYVQLATVDLETNEPRCRTVVFRGFQTFPSDYHHHNYHCDDLSTVLKMCTDARSRKVSESTAGEIVWWFAKSSEQYRMRGKLLYVGGGSYPQDNDKHLATARKELWGNLSDPARESFLDEQVPGQTVQKDATNTCTKIPAGGRDETTGKPMPPPDNFLLMLLIPHHVDYLNLKENYRQIDEQKVADDTTQEPTWSFQQVNA